MIKPKLDGTPSSRVAHYRDINLSFNEVELIKKNGIVSSDDGRLVIFAYGVFAHLLPGTTNIYDSLYQREQERTNKLVILSSYLNLSIRYLRLKVYEREHQQHFQLSATDLDAQVNQRFSIDCTASVTEVCLLHAAMKANESPPREAFILSDALFNNSALSFGVSQFDLGVKGDPEGEQAIEELYGPWNQPTIDPKNYTVARQPIRYLGPADLARLYSNALPELSSKLSSAEAEPVVLKGYLDYLARAAKLAQSREQKMTRMQDANQRMISGVIVADLLNQGNFQGPTLNHAISASSTHCEFIDNLSSFFKPRAGRPQAVIKEFNSTSPIRVDDCADVFEAWKRGS